MGVWRPDRQSRNVGVNGGVELAEQPEVWQLEAYYIGQALADYVVLPALNDQQGIMGALKLGLMAIQS